MEKSGQQTPEKESSSYFTSFLNRIGGIFLAPDSAFTQIISQKISFWEPFILILLLVGIEGAVLASFAVRIVTAVVSVFTPVTGAVNLSILYFFVWLALAVMFLVALIAWVILAAIAHLFARYVFRGQGSFFQLLKLYGYTAVPCSLVILGTVLIGISWAAWPLMQFLAVAAVFWVVLLMALAVKHNYGLDTGKAFISSFIGPMIVQLIITEALWAWIGYYMTSIAGGFV